MIPVSKVYKYYPKLKELLRIFSEKVNATIWILLYGASLC